MTSFSYNVFELTWIIRVSLYVADLAETSMFRQEGVTTYSQLLFDVARQQVVVGARYVFSCCKLVFNYRVNPLISKTTVAILTSLNFKKLHKYLYKVTLRLSWERLNILMWIYIIWWYHTEIRNCIKLNGLYIIRNNVWFK